MPRQDRIGSTVVFKSGEREFTGKVTARKNNGDLLIFCLDGPNAGNTKKISPSDIIQSSAVKEEVKNLIEGHQDASEIVGSLLNEATSRSRLKNILKRKFPDMWMKDGEDFSSSNAGSIWTGEGSFDNDGIPLFDNFATSPLYELGVHKDLVRVLDKHGWFAEFHDGGTVFIWPI